MNPDVQITSLLRGTGPPVPAMGPADGSASPIEVPPCVVPRAPTRIRQDIEAARVLSAFGLVWCHTHSPGYEFAHSGLVVFVVLSVYLAGVHQQRPDFAATLHHRVVRLLVPWVAWFAIYAAINASHHRPMLDVHDGIVAGVLTGPSMHLWYLPYMFVCLLPIDASRRAWPDGRALACACALATIVMLAAVPYWRKESFILAVPFGQYLHALPAVFIGVFFSHFKRLPSGIAHALLIAMWCLACLRLPYEGVAVPYACGIAIGFVLAAEVVTDKVSWNFAAIGRHTFGIYLVHVAVLMVLLHAGMRQGWLLPTTTFGVSLVLVAAFCRIAPRVARFVV